MMGDKAQTPPGDTGIAYHSRHRSFASSRGEINPGVVANIAFPRIKYENVVAAVREWEKCSIGKPRLNDIALYTVTAAALTA